MPRKFRTLPSLGVFCPDFFTASHENKTLLLLVALDALLFRSRTWAKWFCDATGHEANGYSI